MATPSKKAPKSSKSMKGKSSLFRRFLRYFLIAMLIAIAFPTLQVIAYKAIDPPYTWLMFERYWLPDEGHEIKEIKHKPVDLEDVSPHLVIAVMAGEDQNFLEHDGLDIAAIQKAIAYNETHKKKRGASTLSQQTAKNAFLWESRTWVRKGLEVPLTLAIEIAWGKRRILEVYLNTVEFGPGVFGAEAAAQYWFHKSSRKLSLRQACLLAASLPAPRKSNPAKPSAHLSRRAAWIEGQIRNLDRKAMLKSVDLH